MYYYIQPVFQHFRVTTTQCSALTCPHYLHLPCKKTYTVPVIKLQQLRKSYEPKLYVFYLTSRSKQLVKRHLWTRSGYSAMTFRFSKLWENCGIPKQYNWGPLSGGVSHSNTKGLWSKTKDAGLDHLLHSYRNIMKVRSKTLQCFPYHCFGGAASSPIIRLCWKKS